MFDFFYFLFIFPLENLLALVFGAIFAFFKSEVVAEFVFVQNFE